MSTTLMFALTLLAAIPLSAAAQFAPPADRQLVDITPVDPQIRSIADGFTNQHTPNGPDPAVRIAEHEDGGNAKITITAISNEYDLQKVVANRGNCEAIMAMNPTTGQDQFPFHMRYGDRVVIEYMQCVPIEVTVNSDTFVSQ